jgi:DNA-binding transcriptional MerR regulator
MTTNEALYPIREVSSLTGVNSITLRAWERRYGLIEPVRTDGGHRLYTLEHIDTIKAAVKMTKEGIPISQVKARISQIKLNKNDEVITGDYDYQSRLMDALETLDLESVNQELDQVFMNIGDTWLFKLLFEVNQSVSVNSNPAIFTFWESEVLPRLYTRLRFALRYMALHACKKIWVQADYSNSSQVGLLIAVNVLAKNGYYPIINHKLGTQNQSLFECMQQTQCHALAVVDEKQLFDETRWASWTDSHPSLEFHYFTEHAEELAIAKKIQVTAYSI